MTRIELEKVADVFFPDRRALHLVDVSEIVAKLTQKHDWKKAENESDAVKIEREVSHQRPNDQSSLLFTDTTRSVKVYMCITV